MIVSWARVVLVEKKIICLGYLEYIWEIEPVRLVDGLVVRGGIEGNGQSYMIDDSYV